MNPCPCLLCGSTKLTLISPPTPLIGVTSDCKPWGQVAAWAVCDRCGHVQKLLDDRWFDIIDQIYSCYESYPLSDGAEQVVFSGSHPRPRSARLLEQFRQAINIPPKGRLLDIGCGNGAFFRTFGEFFPLWGLVGFEPSNAQLEEVLGTAGVEGFYSGSLEVVEGKFDMITMIYVVEHLPDPVTVMKKARGLLKSGGLFLVQTANLLNNPFDMVVVDHCSHFCLDTLAYAVELAGFKVRVEADDWIPKEIGVVAMPREETCMNISPRGAQDLVKISETTLRWLHRVAEHARQVAGNTRLGILGTAIAGTWLANALGETAVFFLDEDPLRQGKLHMGLPVLKPTEAPMESSIYLAFPPDLAESLYSRLQASYPSVCFIKPPHFPPA